MGLMHDGRATNPLEIDRFEGGVGWIAHPDETARRASHAIVDGDDVYLIDPIDAEGVGETYEDLGTVAGAVVLLGRHTRDAEAFARRHEVPVFFPRALSSMTDDVAGTTRTFDGALPGTEYRTIDVLDTIGWTEVALFDGETLIVPEATGTARYFRAGNERLGVHPFPLVRLNPPSALENLDPERILVGHGEGIHENAGPALADALAGARGRSPRLYAQAARMLLS
ncbi:hypothetical protein BRD17_00290 [Halobacteriales archaeon SW_7_68_16]|nr:MAG: hypothetical protein BRD17_00290 [Halobacteriales archaeon SW_7_68_16]